ncbi:sucrase ferredoxin [Actinomadura sp. HBU206391]|uniref:sucrase ferredoxin n=1 Tax=Actinomadura sp. HBU206391 TaxID=2731692 RepID=UPI00165001E9|nr:sucrase ferredoxin [Actinomadura sp. HBU206391]MBC6462116.1 sucrase ferredoxin [Actinomadura sp. HBU206391]
MADSSGDKGCEHCPGSHTGTLPCLASAAVKARAWLAIEHPGPWPEYTETLDLPAPIARTVEAAERLGIRCQFIRRSGRRRPTPPLWVYAGHCAANGAPAGTAAGSWNTRSDSVWLEGRQLADPAELAELDLAAVAAGVRPGFGDPVPGPLLLVCTHGRRNACCARTGAPLARELRARFGDAVWETTHVGGDRFAANLVCLPHGLYYGSLRLPEAVTAVEAYLRGEVVLDRLRGRAGMPEPAQAAEHYVRLDSGILGVDAVRVESLRGGSPYEATVTAAGRRYRVIVEHSTGTDPCGPQCEENLDTYVLGDLTLLNEASLV